MTVMRAREVRINLILSTALALIGLLMWIVGGLALKNNWFLPEYDSSAKGCGSVFLICGLVWLGLSLIKKVMTPPERAEK